jgi:hypothetical protein
MPARPTRRRYYLISNAGNIAELLLLPTWHVAQAGFGDYQSAVPNWSKLSDVGAGAHQNDGEHVWPMIARILQALMVDHSRRKTQSGVICDTAPPDAVPNAVSNATPKAHGLDTTTRCRTNGASSNAAIDNQSNSARDATIIICRRIARPKSLFHI